MTIALCVAVLLATFAATAAVANESAGFLSVTDFSTFAKSPGQTLGETILTSPELRAPIVWDELVISWNARAPGRAWLKFEARAIYPERATKYYCLGIWSEDDAVAPRESVTGQRDADCDVKTDTLILKHPADRLQLRITLGRPDGAAEPQLRFVGLSFLNSHATPATREPQRAAWGRLIDVPQRSQVPFGERQGWCSPTAVSMVLAHWARILKRPELDIPVPDVARGVYDRNWPGTGNWPFNTAFAGKSPGLRAYVARLGDVAELEEWIVRGVPPIVSVSYGRLYGPSRRENDGHLIVVCGFTKTGDVIVNDPWARLDRGQSVRRIIPRANVAAAWKSSHNTAYLIFPEALVGSR